MISAQKIYCGEFPAKTCLAQSVECTTFNRNVEGSISRKRTLCLHIEHLLTNLASVGKLRLDYVSTAVAKRSVQAMGPIKFDSFIQSLNFDSARLQVNRLMSISSSPIQTPVILSRESSHAEEGEDDESEVDANFNQELASATIEIITSLVPEKKRYSPKKKTSNLISAFDDFYGLELAIPQFITNHWISTQWQEWRETCHLELNYLGEEKMRDSSSQSNVKEANKNSPIAIQRQSTSSSAMNQSNDFCLVNADYDADDCTLPMVGQSIDLVFVIWFMKIIEIQVTAYHKPLSCEQVKEVMLQFPLYGFLRVQCLITLFGRIVNFESFDRVILNRLRPIEQREIFHRIGCLNMLNPYYPERMYEFDLRSWEDREYVKILVKLAVEEVGENWTDEEYRWSKYDEPVAGWKLPESWAVEENDSRNKNSDVGPRRYGRLKFCYSKGCSPSVSVRKSLMNRVLCGSVRPL